jgi:GNAT superfamily N-acetyltransferase
LKNTKINTHINSTNYKIKQISVQEAYGVRHPVLRKGKPLESCAFNGDFLDTTLHFGIFDKEALLGICSLLKNTTPLISTKTQYQLRGMAILKPYQNKGLGGILLKHVENILTAQNIELIWCNARESAVHFYKKNGYNIAGNPFNIKDIGLHYVMYKNL